VIVTVSTRVIQDGLIAFDPPLPLWKQEAYDAIQLGNANKITFALGGRLLGVEGHSSLWAQVTNRQGMYFQLRPFGWDLANGFLAGDIALGLDTLKSIYGCDIEFEITNAACTTWQTDHWIRGAYGAARPGHAHKRKDLATTVDDRLFFAGEAASTDYFSTCHGAHLTGIAAAKAVARTLGKSAAK
jgi:monoamine oxidase